LALELKDAYPELKKSLANVEKVLKREEQRFAQTLSPAPFLYDPILFQNAINIPK
jgi:alanyl-tRNA synthetase